MKTTQTLTAFALVTATAIGMAGQARALDCQNIEMISAWGAGGGTDTFLRMIAKPFGDELGIPVKVLNIEGSMGEIARQELLSRPADGCALVSVDPDVITTTIEGTTEIDLIDDLAPVFRGHVDIGFIHGLKGEFASWDDLVAWGLENPGKLRLGGTGAVGSDRVSIEMALKDAGIDDFIYVPYNTAGEMHADLLGARLHGMYDEMGSVVSLVEGDRIEPLLLIDDSRIEQFPDVPAAGELGYQPAPSNWRGLAAHGDTPAELVQELSDALMAASEDETYAAYERERFLDLKADGKIGAADFVEAIRLETEMKQAAGEQ